jgi:hypothetical protein
MVRWWSVVCLGCAVALGCGRSVEHRDGDGAGASAGAGGDGATGGSGSGAGSGGSSGGKGGSGSGGDGASGTAASGGSGGTSVVGGSAGSAGLGGGTGGVTGGAGSGGAGEAGAPAAPECLLAVRLDECCSAPRPVSRAEFDAEPCYRELLGRTFPRDAACPPITCPAIACDLPVASRMVELMPNGECGFVPECATSKDCALGFDRTECCGCAKALPEVLLSEDSCLTPVGATPSRVCAVCGDVLCESCGEALPVGCMVHESGLNWCGFVVPHEGVTESQCITEQPCVAGTGPGIRCYSPSEAYCAGPAPPPDECDADTDCSDSAYICEPLGHCGQKQCVLGCGSNDDCAAHQDCADQRCVPRTCGLESDCGPTHACLAGVCTRRLCTSSSECGDGYYCVKGECFDEPGRCLDAFAP